MNIVIFKGRGSKTKEPIYKILKVDETGFKAGMVKGDYIHSSELSKMKKSFKELEFELI